MLSDAGCSVNSYMKYSTETCRKQYLCSDKCVKLNVKIYEFPDMKQHNNSFPK